jgi:hypothetical protein
MRYNYFGYLFQIIISKEKPMECIKKNKKAIIIIGIIVITAIIIFNSIGGLSGTYVSTWNEDTYKFFGNSFTYIDKSLNRSSNGEWIYEVNFTIKGKYSITGDKIEFVYEYMGRNFVEVFSFYRTENTLTLIERGNNLTGGDFIKN